MTEAPPTTPPLPVPGPPARATGLRWLLWLAAFAALLLLEELCRKGREACARRLWP